MDYNLLEEPWIPVLWRDGRANRVGILEALREAHRIRQIVATNPMDRVAILRFLLALLYWSKGNPPEDWEPGADEPFPTDWFAKIEEHGDHFNLLSLGMRFYQAAGDLRAQPSTRLIQEVPAGNNFVHFRHSIDEQDGLCIKCCAMGLLRLPLFSVTVPKPKWWTGINGVPPVYVVPSYRTLSDTLRANWLHTPDSNIGIPSWIRPNTRLPSDGDIPVLTGLTLLSRTVWLHDPGPFGTCIGCGENATLIRTCQFESAGKQESDRWNDPHVIYSDTIPRKSQKAPDLSSAGKFRLDRPWSAMHALTAAATSGSGLYFVVGFATDQAKNIDVWERTLSIPEMDNSEVEKDSIRLWYKQGAQLEKRVSRSKVEGKAMVALIRPQVEDKVAHRSYSTSSDVDPQWVHRAAEYGPMMNRLASSLSPGFTVAAEKRRQEISRIAPDMRTQEEKKVKKTRKKASGK